MIPSNVVQFQGQGQVSADNLNTFLQTCTTAVQLRGFLGVSGMQVSLLGIAAPGDDGGGLFYWQQGSGFTDDNFSVIVPYNYTNGAWLRNSITVLGSRNYLTAPLTIWTNGTTGNDANSGMTAGKPLQHLQTALNLALNHYDLGGQPVTINCAGNYANGVTMLGAPVGGNSQSVSFVGAGATLSPLNANGFFAYGAGAGFIVSGFTIALGGTGYYSSVAASGGGRIELGSGIGFGNTLQAHANATFGGQILFNASYALTGNGVCHWDADGSGALIYASGITISILGSPGFTNFAFCSHDATIWTIANTFSGLCTATWGVNVQANGVVETNGAQNVPPINSMTGQTAAVFKSTGGVYR